MVRSSVSGAVVGVPVRLGIVRVVVERVSVPRGGLGLPGGRHIVTSACRAIIFRVFVPR